MERSPVATNGQGRAADPDSRQQHQAGGWRVPADTTTPSLPFDMLPGAQIALDSEGRIKALTGSAAALFGRAAEDCRDRLLPFLLPELGLSDVDVDSGDTTGRHRAGEILHLHWQRAGFDPTSGLQILLVTNLAETRHMQRELAREKANVARLRREFERFAYVASHDLQEPLRMVASFTELLTRRYRDHLDEQGQEFLQFAHDGARRMRLLLNALFEYSHLGVEQLATQQVDLTQIYNEAVRTLSLALKDAGGVIVSSHLPQLTGSRAHLRTLFYHLLGNSIKFRSPERPLRVEVSAERVESAWRLCFTDNGSGITPEYRTRVLAMFQRLPRDRRLPGAGMGLALCRKICELQGGCIEIETPSAPGTRVIVTWPDAAR